MGGPSLELLSHCEIGNKSKKEKAAVETTNETVELVQSLLLFIDELKTTVDLGPVLANNTLIMCPEPLHPNPTATWQSYG